ncbi:MAG: hypothetical protein Q9227_007213 [Pyrenula ochraceoflavens]
MARRRDSRSPSPVGSSHSASKRRRDDDRYEKGRGGHRRRSRSRSPDVRPNKFWHACFANDIPQRRYRDHDRERDRDRNRDVYRRRDRSLDRRRDRRDDRREDDAYRSSRKERSRERRRSRDREDRRRSRDRDYKYRRDDSRGATRRLEDSADMKRNGRRAASGDRTLRKEGGNSNEVCHVFETQDHQSREHAHQLLQSSRPQTPTKPASEDQKAAKLAKLEAWKQAQAAKQAEKAKELEATGGTRGILNQIDQKAANPVSTSPKSPEPPTAPTHYAGKFDPKAIAKKSTITASAAAPLGADVVPAQASSAKPSIRPSKSSAPLKARGNLSGFGLNNKPSAGSVVRADVDVSKRALNFDEEESTRKKLEKLPTPPLGDMPESDRNKQGQPEEDDEEDIDMQDAGNEEENLAAARAAAEKREELLQQRSQDEPEEQPTGHMTANGDSVMADVDDVDPLDAFMSGLTDVPRFQKTTNGSKFSKSRQQEPEALFENDEMNMEAVGNDTEDLLAIASKKKKKDIPTVNHAKTKYDSFRKNFYSEPVDLADLTEDEVASLRMELDGIKVRGLDVPKPVTNWAQCGLGVQPLDVIRKLNYDAPTSIQAQAIPAIMSGRDVIGVAKTGSGKTIAFLLPMFRHIKDQKPLESLDGPIGLILSPTRELATQIHRECRPFLKALNLRAVCAYGGAPIKDQIADLKRGAEIIVCTPGRMIDLLAANSGRVTNLRRVTYTVLDEADRMFDMGFEPQVMKILANIRPDKQTVLFSATFPRAMEALARKTLVKPIEIIVGGRSVVAPEITQIVEVRKEETKFIRLLELLGKLYEDEKNEDDRVLIFVERQESADSLLRELMRKGYPCMSIHGGKDQIDRDSTIADFKAGVVPILIATSVAARGLDVKQLKLVVNFDPPNHLEDYVHRAGRTGRAGNTGTAVTFIMEEQERFSVDIAKALRQSGQSVPEPVQKLVDGFTEKVKAGKERAGALGFGGKGLERLDQERDAAKARERKTFKTGEEGEEDEKEEQQDTSKADDLFSKAASGVRSANTPAMPASSQLPGVPKGIDLDGKITVHRTEREDKSTATAGRSQMDKVAAAVAGINDKLSRAGVMRQGVPIDNKGPDAGAFHATLEINDFPQKARWAVTNRTNVAKILESTGTSITTKGSFYATGKEPQQGENPKLYILVEGDTEVVVEAAMRELMRLLKEGTMAAADADTRGGGRYSVV